MDTADRHCAKCEYDLTGLRNLGRCPECGSYFNTYTGEGIQKEISGQEKFDRAMCRLRTILLVLAAAGVMICSGVIEWFRSPVGQGSRSWWDSQAMWTGGLIAAILLMAALTSFVYEKDEK